jgi:acetyltransferase
VLFLGLGCSPTSRHANGPVRRREGLARIASFHERQDARYAAVAAEVSDATGKPILCATELAVTDPENPGPRGVRESGRYCWSSADRAVRSLEHAWHHVRHRARHSS